MSTTQKNSENVVRTNDAIPEAIKASDKTRFVLLLLLGIVSEWLVWNLFLDGFVCFYTGVFIFVSLARVFEWPNPGWFALSNLEAVRSKAAATELRGLRYEMRVGDFEETKGFRPFFASLIYGANTETLCNEINQSLPPKIIIYGAALLIYMFLAHRSAPSKHSDEVELVLKGVIVAIISLLPLIWDYARCELHNYLNKELRLH